MSANGFIAVGWPGTIIGSPPLDEPVASHPSRGGVEVRVAVVQIPAALLTLRAIQEGLCKLLGKEVPFASTGPKSPRSRRTKVSYFVAASANEGPWRWR